MKKAWGTVIVVRPTLRGSGNAHYRQNEQPRSPRLYVYHTLAHTLYSIRYDALRLGDNTPHGHLSLRCSLTIIEIYQIPKSQEQSVDKRLNPYICCKVSEYFSEMQLFYVKNVD